jgi:hypothetical protein
MTILFSEVLRVHDKASNRDYDILVSFNETRSASVSRLDIEILPLIVHAPTGGKIVSRRCTRPTARVSFDLEIRHPTQDARFATRRDVLLPDYLYSCGLGSYVFNKLISWGQPIAPTFVFQRLFLSSVDANTDEAKQRRNGFYRAHGFQLDFSQDRTEQEGYCLSAPLSSLKVREISTAKILSVRAIDQFIHSQLEENRKSQQDLLSQETKTATLQAVLDGYKRRNKKLKLLIFALILLLPHATAVAAGSNCAVAETVVFSCAVGNGAKLVSLCASPRLSARTGTLYYRFGTPSKIELEYPTRPDGAARKFKHVHYSRSEVDRFEVTFAIGSTTYAVFDYYEESESPKYQRGVRVTTEGENPQETTLACTGAVTSHLPRLEGKVPCDADSALAQCDKFK